MEGSPTPEKIHLETPEQELSRLESDMMKDAGFSTGPKEMTTEEFAASKKEKLERINELKSKLATEGSIAYPGDMFADSYPSAPISTASEINRRDYLIVQGALDEIRQRTGFEPTADTVSEITGLPVTDVERLMNMGEL